MKWYQHIFGEEDSRAKYKKEAEKEYRDYISGYKDNIQRPFLKDHTINKGTELICESLDKKSGLMYANYKKPDIDRVIANNHGKKIETYTTTKPLKVAGEETVTKVVEDFRGKTLDKAIRKVANEYVDPHFRRINSQQLYKSFLDDYTASSIESFSKVPKIQKAFCEKLTELGYDAFTNVRGVGMKNDWAPEGVDPLIIVNKNAYSYKGEKVVNEKTARKAATDYEQWIYDTINSSGKNVNFVYRH